jgi:hypothetical protein
MAKEIVLGIYGSGWVLRRHAAFAPASQKRLDSRLRSPLPFGGIAQPVPSKARNLLRSSQRPLSLSYGLLDTQPEPY